MKKLFLIFAVAMCSTLAIAQTNQYFWASGHFIMGNPINQIDSITFGQLEQTDSILLYLPRTVKVVHDTVVKTNVIHDTIYVTIHDTINPCEIPTGAVSGIFSVSDTTKVYFSHGNLQFNAALDSHECADGTTKNGTWRFAENQYDAIGYTNRNQRSATYNGWIDLFCIGTSGWNSGAKCYEPWTKGWLYNQSDFYIGGDSINSAVGKWANADWGVYNAISNGGNQPNMWRLLTYLEFKYLYEERKNATQLYGKATVNGMVGLVILPDDWTPLQEISFVATTADCTTNTYNAETWKIMEDNGAVFLPNAGQLWDGLYNQVGYYWSSSQFGLGFRGYTLGDGADAITLDLPLVRKAGLSVRLVHEVK